MVSTHIYHCQDSSKARVSPDLGYWAKTLSKWLYKNQQRLSRWQSDQHWVDSADLRGFWVHKTLTGPQLTFVIDWWLAFWAFWNFGKLPLLHLGVQNSKRVRVKKEESINKPPPDNNVFGLNQFWGDVWFLVLLVIRGKNCFWLRLSALTFITAKTHQRPGSGSRFGLLSQDLVKMTV